MPTVRVALGLFLAVLVVGYALGVIAAAWATPEKGFVASVGRQVVDIAPGSAVEAAGVLPGDRVVALDGTLLRSTLTYADRVLTAEPGTTMRFTFARSDGSEREVAVVLSPGGAPWPALLGTVLSVLMLALGLVALRGQAPGASRFFATCLVFAVVYTGTLHWNELVAHPLLISIALLGLFVAPGVAVDFLLTFPTHLGLLAHRVRMAGWAATVLLFAGTAVALHLAVEASARGEDDSGPLRLVTLGIGLQLALTATGFATGLALQRAAMVRAPSGEARAQLRWLLFGFSLSAIPIAIGAALAVRDFQLFLIRDARAVATLFEVIWFGAASLAVLRVRLADVDAVIHRSATYLITLGTVVLLALALAVTGGLLAEQVSSGARWLAPLVAALAAAVLFGPVRDRVAAELDRRFSRDRSHYVAALRELGGEILSMRDPSVLAQRVLDGTVSAVRARGGALRLGEDETRVGEHEGGIEIPIERAGRRLGTLALGGRADGQLYGTDDRALLEALASQIAIALENARAFDVIAVQNEEIRVLRDRAEDESRWLKQLLARRASETRLVGSSPAVRELRKKLTLLARSTATVLVLGESGSGKGVVARALHEESERASGPFIHVDCGAIPRGVFESELFGHERGAFTGAARARRGACELADGGTLFFDEVGELPLDLQPKLLRFLEGREVVRLGGSKPVPVDVRVVAATHRDLRQMVARGEWREDLYYRLSVVTVEVPPLRARKTDVVELVTTLLPALLAKNHRPPRMLSEDALDRLVEHHWPGNVRELENVLERAIVLAEGERIEVSDLALPEIEPALASVRPAASSDLDHGSAMDAIERDRLRAVLEATGKNQSKAARALGIPRTTLIHKLRKHGLA